jgi:adenylosuccinate lyase
METSTTGRVADPGIRHLFSEDSQWQAWLDVEAALALAEAERGLIPETAAQVIQSFARIERFDKIRIHDSVRRTSHGLTPLIWELSRVCGEEAGGWVHWGATTQNITQTGELLIVRRVHRILLKLLSKCLDSMADLADAGADMLMAGRTHGQHAVPATFGFKVAVWIDEFIRHAERLRAVEPRVFVGMFGGAAGTFASLGAEGPAVQAIMSARLGLEPMRVPARSLADHLAEYLCLTGLLGATCGKIGREIYTLMKTEFGELEEPILPGTVGSSTMPQKRNPHLCQDIIAGAAIVRSLVPLGLEAVQAEHEGDRTDSLMMGEAIQRACVESGDILSRLELILSGLRVNPDRMRENLDLSNGLIMAEGVMLRLGTIIGRQEAHELVYESAQRAAIPGSPSFADLLSGDPRVTAHLPPDEIRESLNPANYVGLCPELAHEGAARAREASEQLITHAETLGSAES